MWSPRADAAELDEGDGAKLNALRLQALPDGGAAVRCVGLHGRGRQAVADGQHDALPREQVAQDGLIFFVKAAAEVRPGQVFVLAFAHGLHKGVVIFLPEALRHEGEDAVLRGGVVGAEAQQRGRGVARAAAAEAKAGGGLCLEGAEFRAVGRVRNEVLRPQVDRCEVGQHAVVRRGLGLRALDGGGDGAFAREQARAASAPRWP